MGTETGRDFASLLDELIAASVAEAAAGRASAYRVRLPFRGR